MNELALLAAALLMGGCTYADPCWGGCAESCDKKHPPWSTQHGDCVSACAQELGCSGEPRGGEGNEG